MVCPLCGKRKARRPCPAVGNEICPVCCGTKRLVELACPPDCPYLAAAEAHPPASVRKRRERDVAFAAPMVHRLSEAGYRLLLAFQETISRYRPSTLPPLTDQDVAEAAGALAATLETAGKGIIFEHQARSIPAQRLVSELRATFAALARTPSSTLERDAATALRRIEDATKRASRVLEGGEVAYLEFLGRLPKAGTDTQNAEAVQVDEAASASPRLILP